eukprot:c22969_g1_i1 orf=138-1907(+)
MDVCEACGSQSVSLDIDAGVVACEACGLVRQETDFRHAEFDDEGTKLGSFVGGRGTAGSLGLGRPAWTLAPGSCTGFRSDYKKTCTLAKLDHLSSLLRLPKDKIEDVKHIIGIVTEEKWGAHRWVDVLIGSCIYIVARQHRLPLSAAEIANTLNCPVKDVLRMYHRVLDFMEIQSTPFDPAVYLDKVMSHHPAFMSMERDVVRRLARQGHCLLRYGVEWSLAAGRHPLALVAAVVVIIGRANNIKVDMKVVSRELHVHPATSRLRFNEFMDSLVGFGQRLPWGKDITLKTVSRHLPFLLQYLETRMKMDHNQVLEKSGVATVTEAVSGEDVALRHIAKALYAKYGPQIRAVLESQPFDVVSEEDSDSLSVEGAATDVKKRKMDTDAHPYDSVPCSDEELGLMNPADCGKQAAVGPVPEDDRKTNTTWKPLPPSFVANGVANAKRIARIEAAKKRIATVKQDMANQMVREIRQESHDETPLHSIELPSSVQTHDLPSLAQTHARPDEGLDAEDFLIQYCLIRGANEEILKAGYYSLVLSTAPVQPDKEIMSDSDLLKYFRTPREIEFLQSLSNEESISPWFTRDELDSQA